MTFLPIVERELRVAARRKATYWSRIGAAGLAIFIFAAVIGLSELSRGRMSFGGELGTILFAIFSWLSFAFACSAGVFLTADSLSEEKREGTLGLLFLTDLRGYDVVFGKLFSHSFVAAYGLLAAFPVIGIAFLLGGVTGGEFWRLVLVLFNTLFFSLAAGVLISAISRDAQRAMSGAAMLCGLFVALFPAIDWAMADWDVSKFESRFSLASPAYGLTEARSLVLSDFWTCLLMVHGIAWMFLVLASVLAPRSWQETATKSTSGSGSRAQRLRFGSPIKRAAFRVRWLAENPVRWLAGRDLWMGRFLWFMLLGATLLTVLFAASAEQLQVVITIGTGATGLFVLLMNLWVAAFATRFFVDAMRTGTMELLLATPLQAAQVVRGQWWALRRTFAVPILVLMLLEAGLNALQIEESIRNSLKNSPTYPVDVVTYQIVNSVCSLLTSMTGLFAVAWFGMWMGLTTKKANHAVLKTIVFVQVLPFIALMFVNIGLIFTLSFAGSSVSSMWLAQPIVTLLSIAMDIAFIVIARKKLLNQVREIAAQSSGEVSGDFRLPKFWSRKSGEMKPVT